MSLSFVRAFRRLFGKPPISTALTVQKPLPSALVPYKGKPSLIKTGQAYNLEVGAFGKLNKAISPYLVSRDSVPLKELEGDLVLPKKGLHG